MIVFTRKYPIQRMIKKRHFHFNKICSLRYGTVGLFCLHTFRFEYRYCLFLRKFYKRIFNKRKRKIVTFYRRRAWLFIRPNYTLTHKSKNSRMGKGKGNFNRWCTIVYPGKIFIEHINVSPRLYKLYMLKIKKKLKIHLKMFHKTSTTLKLKNINSGVVTKESTFELLRVRKQLYSNIFNEVCIM